MGLQGLGNSVLIVEDDILVSGAVQAALGLAGYRARSAHTCSAALALALEERPDLLVLDISLPDGSGWGLLYDLRRALPAYNLPVIVISSAQVSRTQLRAEGVGRYIPKPFDVAHLVQAVGELLPVERPGA